MKSTVRPENRIWFHTHDSAATFLSGTHLKVIASYFQRHLKDRVRQFTYTKQWSDPTDLYSLVHDLIFSTQIDTLYGKSFLLMNPNFVSDFRTFHHGIPYLLRGYPRWLIPKTWDARERCLEAIKQYHISRDEWKVDSNDKTEADEEHCVNYGSDFIRARKLIHSKMEGLDADAVASSELGVIWAYVLPFLHISQ